MQQLSYSVLVVDDTPEVRDLLRLLVSSLGYQVDVAEDGLRALDLLKQKEFDLILLDIMMPHMSGYQVLERLQADELLRHIPVVVISAVSDLQSVVKCIELGADDYLPKPFNSVLLKARINSSLAKKRLHDQEQAYLRLVQQEQEKAERLLLNILPAPIAERLKAGESLIADHFEAVTVLFADIVNFTRLSGEVTPQELVCMLNEIFSVFDQVTQDHGLEKIKTSGDSYMIASGLPIPRSDHAEVMADVALSMRSTLQEFKGSCGPKLTMRIGMHSGPVVAGVIGQSKFVYDLWGDTVNIASRMERQGVPGVIQVSEPTYNLLKDKYEFEERGYIDLKGKGAVRAYLLMGRL